AKHAAGLPEEIPSHLHLRPSDQAPGAALFRSKVHESPCTSIRHRISISRDPVRISFPDLADVRYGSQKLMVQVCVQRLIIPIQPSGQPAACS
ncbi:unnamed protein product, partial [Urochloa humidicola]